MSWGMPLIPRLFRLSPVCFYFSYIYTHMCCQPKLDAGQKQLLLMLRLMLLVVWLCCCCRCARFFCLVLFFVSFLHLLQAGFWLMVAGCCPDCSHLGGHPGFVSCAQVSPAPVNEISLAAVARLDCMIAQVIGERGFDW